MNCSTQSTNLFASSNQMPRTQFSLHYDGQYQLMWCYMHSAPRPCFTPTLLDELLNWCGETSSWNDSRVDRPFRYHVLASRIPGVFNLGGDLDLFRRLVLAQDRASLFTYAKACIDVLYANMTHFGRSDVTTISLVQGDALGGGFEGAMSSNVLIAERSAKMGLPEVLFNLFPGMGAYSFLSRKLGSAQARRIILSGKVYTAEELYDLGVVDVLAEDGQGEKAVYDYIKRENKSRNAYRALREVQDSCDPISYEELIKIGEIWVEAAMRLQSSDLRMMERLVSRQSSKGQSAA
ncbi:MAG: crotonase/enoyl-CoA hydratase family protein [Pseudomonadota bacterium]|uniref:crotonase/enoyl-CoA hydratase family protein n=1 Tax=Thermithiobacillus tepidarius TaxID=929 RepID=UPI000414FAB6|nr:crotonase/enoyl-CoA hydratase family protein [Thermithiobacillus tepidarius]